MRNKRPEILTGETRKISTPCGSIFVTVNLNRDRNGIEETFIKLGKSGSCSSAMLEALGRIITLALRTGVSQEDIKKSLMGIQCGSCDNTELYSCPHAVSICINPKMKEIETIIVPTPKIDTIKKGE